MRKTPILLLVSSFLLSSCTVGIVHEDALPGLSGSPTPDWAMQATITALQAQNAALATRMASWEQTLTPTLPPTSTPTPTPKVVRVVVTATPALTQTPAHTQTPSPTPTLIPCSIAVGADFQVPFGQRPSDDSLGCPVAVQERVWSAEQIFEGGRMFWRQGRDDAFVLFNAGSKMVISADVYNEGEPDDACPELGLAPAGYFKPLRGFNRQWCRNPEVREQLGWALANEVGYETVWQSFEHADVVKSNDGHIFVLSHDGSWSYTR